MKQFRNIFHQQSELCGQKPMELACAYVLDNGFLNKRCLYKWVS